MRRQRSDNTGDDTSYLISELSMGMSEMSMSMNTHATEDDEIYGDKVFSMLYDEQKDGPKVHESSDKGNENGMPWTPGERSRERASDPGKGKGSEKYPGNGSSVGPSSGSKRAGKGSYIESSGKSKGKGKGKGKGSRKGSGSSVDVLGERSVKKTIQNRGKAGDSSRFSNGNGKGNEKRGYYRATSDDKKYRSYGKTGASYGKGKGAGNGGFYEPNSADELSRSRGMEAGSFSASSRGNKGPWKGNYYSIPNSYEGGFDQEEIVPSNDQA